MRQGCVCVWLVCLCLVCVCVGVWAVRKCSMGKKKKKGSKMVNVLNGPNPIYYPLSDDLFKQLAHYRLWPRAEISVWVGI